MSWHAFPFYANACPNRVTPRAYNRSNVPLGLYISIPFCRTKCSYCNFASDVFSRQAYENYVASVIEDVAHARALSAELGGNFDETADSIYLGGGTPSILESTQLLRIFQAVRDQFQLTPDAEITVECAPGTLTDPLIATLLAAGVNRVSLGVQSFVDQEAHSVGRQHNRSTVIEEVARLRQAGIHNLNVDLIAGLPHQTKESWTFSLDETIALAVPHVSVYMLEVDEDSRLGREVLAGGTRYHAHFVPDDAATADFYEQACQVLDSAGVRQYEISNFAHSKTGAPQASTNHAAPGSVRASTSAPVGGQSRHNLKYWTRQPYLGFGVDAHSMLVANHSDLDAIRFASPDSLDGYMNRVPHTVTRVSAHAALEEALFLGLRLNRGVDLTALAAAHSLSRLAYQPIIEECQRDGLLDACGPTISLTPRGRLLSNEVFARFLLQEDKSKAAS